MGILQGGLRARLVTAVDTLEALDFLTQSLEGQASTDIADIRAAMFHLTRSARLGLLDSMERDIKLLREHFGAIAKNAKYREIFAEAKSKKLFYLPKITIDRHLFARYEAVFSRWPHIRLHAYVPFDGAELKSLNWVFELEATHIGDATRQLRAAQKLFDGIRNDPHIPRAERQNYRTTFSASIMSIFNFLESYLNGIAYDCFIKFHDDLPIADHDVLSEWDSKIKRRRYVNTERKIFEYPKIIAEIIGVKLDLSGCKPAHYLASGGKAIRDALTHSSPYVDPDSGEYEKAARVLYLTHVDAEELYVAAVEYALEVETALYAEPRKTAPWLYSDDGESLSSALKRTIFKEPTYLIFP